MLILSAATGLAVFLATPAVLRRLPEPRTGPRSRRRTADPDDAKIPYAALATRRFAAIVGVLSAAAVAVPALALPRRCLPGWLVLATLGLLLAAIDARTTWLPLPLTRVAWVAMAAATGARRGPRRLGPAGPRTRRVPGGRRGVRGDLAGHPRRDRLR